MGLCYSSKGKTGDLPPRPEYGPQWYSEIKHNLKDIRLILLIGQYVQKYYLGKKRECTLTEIVKNYRQYLPDYFVLPHPPPRNNISITKNSCVKSEVPPVQAETIAKHIKKQKEPLVVTNGSYVI